jgi:hypothetical protein
MAVELLGDLLQRIAELLLGDLAITIAVEPGK